MTYLHHSHHRSKHLQKVGCQEGHLVQEGVQNSKVKVKERKNNTHTSAQRGEGHMQWQQQGQQQQQRQQQHQLESKHKQEKPPQQHNIKAVTSPRHKSRDNLH